MLAHHPRTGKEIRVIQTDATVWRENKTLIYSEHPSIWDTVYEGLLSDGTGPTFRLVLGTVDADEFKIMATKSKLVLISKVALDSIGTEAFKKLSVNNVIYLEEIHLMYPHLGEAWDGSKEDAAIIMAGLLRFRKVAGVWSPRAPLIGCVKEDSAPPRLWWITQFFKHEKSKRAAEIRKCLRENSKSRLIDKILLLNESPQEFPASSKIVEEVIGHRLTYQDVIERIYDIPDDVVVVFANADIFIDDNSWRDIWSLNLEDKFLALLRYDVSATWDVAEAKIFGPRADSQDTWVVRALDIKKRAKDSWNLGFKFGKMGCDNLLALEMMKQKFLVSNPSQSLRTYHVHTSDVRNYNKTDVIEAPVFHYIQPSAINDLQAEFKLPKVQPTVLKRVVHGSAASIDAWKKANKPAIESLESLEVFTPNAEQRICVDGPCFQTTEGLVFDSEKMYIGDTASSKLLWNNSKIHGMMPSLGVGHALIVPWPVGADKSKEVYCVRYISKVLRLWSGQGEFFGSEEPAFEQVLQLFTWNEESLPIITREDNSLIWCKSAVGFCHEQNPVLKEDMDALRKYMRGWVPEIRSRKLVIMEDGIVMTSAVVLELEKSLEAEYDVKVVYPSKTSIERIVDVFSGAWGMVGACGISAVGWNWMLPVGAHVFEVNSSKTIGLEISSASQLNHYFVGKAEILEQVGAAASAFASASAEAEADPSLPTVFLPSATGFFAHPGDSFREMVGLWKKAGYINVRQHDGTQVWWGSVGSNGILLYDRPTNEWRLAAPEAEREWHLALFGNPKPSASNAVPWTFWPRRPSLLEALSASANVKGYDERSQGPVFYGKTENAVQERRRQGDWVSVCEEFVMVKDNYPLTQTEYLEKLGSTRFGLCLPGYGFKCHREIECMAMGCVPLVSEWVDMSSYANPPVQGKHYFRLKNSRDIPAVVASVSKESWEEMSAACRLWWAENASCKGSFELTRRLCSVAESNVAKVATDVSGNVVTDVNVVTHVNVVTDVSGNDVTDVNEVTDVSGNVVTDVHEVTDVSGNL